MPDPEIVRRVAESTGLDIAHAERVVDDVVVWYREQVADYVRRRHRELKTYGRHNDEIFALIADEVAGRVFAAPPLTTRQVRRIVYG